MDTALLKTFLEVARLRHFGKAADRLCVTQSAVSARIKLLEETLGVELFERRRNDIRITPAGLRLQRHAETIVQGWERARQEVVLQDDISNVMAIGFQPDLWSIMVCDGVIRLLAEQPSLALRLNASPQALLVEQLIAGNLDMAILFEPPHLPEMQIHHLADIPLVLASSHLPEQQPGSLDPDYIYVDWGSSFARFHAQAHSNRSPRVQCNVGFMARDLIDRIGGTAYLAQQTLEPDAGSSPAPVKDAPLIERAAYAVYRAEHAQLTLLDTLKETFAGAKAKPQPA